MTKNSKAAPGWHREAAEVAVACDLNSKPLSAPAPILSHPPVIDWTAPGAHALLHGLASARLAGKELTPRRPSLIFRLAATEARNLVVKPRLVSSPTGWRLLDCLPLQLVSDRPGGVSMVLSPDDRLSVTRWWKDADRTAADLEILRLTLRGFAADPGQAVRLGLTHCAICQHKLKDPESIQRGIGPECWAPFEAVIRAVEKQRMEGTRNV